MLNFSENETEAVSEEKIIDEDINLNYLHKQKFQKTLPELVKKLKNKKVVLYGAGVFLETIKKHFDLSGINIVGIADRKFNEDNNETFLGYKCYAPDQIESLEADYLLISTKYYIEIAADLYDKYKGKIKIKPLVKKSFLTLLKEVIG